MVLWVRSTNYVRLAVPRVKVGGAEGRREGGARDERWGGGPRVEGAREERKLGASLVLVIR